MFWRHFVGVWVGRRDDVFLTNLASAPLETRNYPRLCLTDMQKNNKKEEGGVELSHQQAADQRKSFRLIPEDDGKLALMLRGTSMRFLQPPLGRKQDQTHLHVERRSEQEEELKVSE
ncbi:hypothetical protein Q5P01_015343 [Channa striata]|uniref:Uncharacterized protein n=1 Tax=Channa striata TaxID=64152 RepID=A0AA88SHN5_CHASR|nr:hypothetical protein Q5P01_015343 [Channa striata]